MKSNNLKTVGLLTASIVMTSVIGFSRAFAEAGDGKGNGGGGFYCPGKVGHLVDPDTPERVLLLDLWEARNELTLFRNKPIEIVTSEAPVQIQAAEAYAKLKRLLIDPMLRDSYLPEANGLFHTAKVVNVKKNINIRFPSDAKARFDEAGCVPVGLGLFDDTTNTFYRKADLIDKMSKMDQAALLIHEVVYKMFREAYNVTDSTLARKITALLFSSIDWKNASTQVPMGGFDCVGKHSQDANARAMIYSEAGNTFVEILSLQHSKNLQQYSIGPRLRAKVVSFNLSEVKKQRNINYFLELDLPLDLGSDQIDDEMSLDLNETTDDGIVDFTLRDGKTDYIAEFICRPTYKP